MIIFRDKRNNKPSDILTKLINNIQTDNNVLLSNTFKSRKYNKDIYNKVIIFDNSCFQNIFINEILNRNNVRPIYLKFIKGDLNKVYPNLLDYYDTKYKLNYNKSWLINKNGIILILLANKNGIYNKDNILTVDNIIPIIKQIKKQCHQKIIIRPHRKNRNIILHKDVCEYLKKNEIEIDRIKSFRYKIQDLKCIIADMTCFALYFGYLGIPLFNFSNKSLKKINPYHDIYLTDMNIINDDKFEIINFKNVTDKYKFYNEYMNKLWFPNDEKRDECRLIL